MKHFIPVILILFALAAFTGYSQDGLKKNTQIDNTVEVAVAAPDGVVNLYENVTPNYTKDSLSSTPDTEEGSAVVTDSGGGDRADAKLAFCTHSGQCTLTRHVATDPWQTNHVRAIVRSSRAEARFGQKHAHAILSTKSRKASTAVPPIGSLSSRQ